MLSCNQSFKKWILMGFGEKKKFPSKAVDAKKRINQQRKKKCLGGG